MCFHFMVKLFLIFVNSFIALLIQKYNLNINLLTTNDAKTIKFVA